MAVSVHAFTQKLLDFFQDHRKLTLAVAGASTTYVVLKWLQQHRYQKKLRGAVHERQSYREHQLNAYKGRLRTNDAKTVQTRVWILSLSLEELSEKLNNEDVTAIAVLEAYQWKALEAQERTNCVCLFIDEAMKEAKNLDEKYKGSSKPPLFGIPISLKESVLETFMIQVKGHDSTMGYVQKLLDPASVAPEDGEYVKWLKKMGAVPFVRSNVPQTLLTYSCSNPIYGTTNHPMSKEHTPGGSSGGCAAMVGCGAALLSIGSDLGGSIRVPAHFCGVTGLRPTSKRSTLLGSAASGPSVPWAHSVRGPLARDVSTLARFYKVYYGEELFSMDRLLAPMPFNDEVYRDRKPLKIGYLSGDPYFMPVNACQRAVAVARDILSAKGHDLVKIEGPGMLEVEQTFVPVVLLDGGKRLQRMLQNDIVDQEGVTVLDRSILKSRACIRLLRVADSLGLLPRVSRSQVDKELALNTEELLDIYQKAAVLQRKMVRSWADMKLDAVLWPAFGTPTVPHNVPSQLMFAAGYAAIFNCMDFPAGVLKVTNVTKQDLAADHESFNRGSAEGKLVYEATRNTEGMPVGVQVVAYPYRDEVCLRVMKEIEDGTQE